MNRPASPAPALTVFPERGDFAVTMLLRRRKDGTLSITGEPPAEHAFTSDWLARAIESGDASAAIVLHTDAGDVTYDLKSFTDEDGSRNPTALRCALAGTKKRKG